MIDLHCHSTRSDGVLSPADIIALAETRELSAVALTDHDTVDGLDEFIEAGRERTLCSVPGVEIACLGGRGTIMHILGLWPAHGDPSLTSMLTEIQQHRRQRNHEILERLGQLGMPLHWDEVRHHAQGNVVGRPHFARALVTRGLCPSLKQAFICFLGRGKPAYVPRRLPNVKRVLGVLGGSGAVCIWAHPLMSGSISGAKLRRLCRGLAPHGLDGIEAYYAEYTPHQTRSALEHARALGLLASGGSDFHGDNIPGIELGRGRGNLAVPDELLVPLLARAREKQERRA